MYPGTLTIGGYQRGIGSRLGGVLQAISAIGGGLEFIVFALELEVVFTVVVIDSFTVGFERYIKTCVVLVCAEIRVPEPGFTLGQVDDLQLLDKR